MDRLEQRISEGKFRVNEDNGMIESRQSDDTFIPVGHEGNLQDNRVIAYRDDEGKMRKVPAQRMAWRIHRGEWPPSDMSVMMVNGDKGDFRRNNLMLVPRGRENTAKAQMRRQAA